MKCSKCGKDITSKFYPGNTCQGCYLYYHKGGTDNPVPPIGTIKHDNRGYIICHMCGRAYKRLGSHIKESHNMTINDYKIKFGLCNNSKTTEAKYSSFMRNLAYKYDMPNRLIETGKETRIKKGEKDKRLGKKSRLQECIERSERLRNKKNNK